MNKETHQETYKETHQDASGDALAIELMALGIAFTLYEHPAVMTVADSTAIHDAMPGTHTKNLFLKDAGGQFWLVTVEHTLRVDLKALAAALGARKFSFAKAEDMAALLGLTPGSVTPLGAMNDTQGRVTIVLDTPLAEAERVHVHPLRNTATIGLSGADLCRALAHWRHEALIVSVPQMANPPS